MGILFLVKLLLLSVLVSAYSEYAVSDIFQNNSCIKLTLEYRGNQTYYIKPSSPIIKKLSFTIFAQTSYDFYFKIVEFDKERYQIPTKAPFPEDPAAEFSTDFNYADYVFSYRADPFDFTITRKKTEAILFSTYQRNIIFSEHYIEIGT